ncbi:ROK family protein [Burkholderia guangdongensis]|uniref:ROK family protein n=1 Tax=Burkholderia guangdongensis TaxID=1792500 RepID=UPI0015C72103|nr:ROK family protein [Burkholderia guangdongensis]
MSSRAENGVRAGIDLGGTGVRIVVADQGAELASRTLPTALFSSIAQEDRTLELANAVRQMVPDGRTLLSLGIGASGPVDSTRGVIENTDTLPAFSHFPLVSEMSRLLEVPVVIDNDAVVAAIGEFHLGAGAGSRRMLMVTLGTGVGVSLLIDGQPFRAANGTHPEGGHIPVFGNAIRCYCGLQGCWESLASRSWLQQELLKVLPDVAYASHDLPFFQEQCQRNPPLQALFHRYGRYVGRGLGTLIMLYGPDVTVLSGSAARLYPLYRQGVEESLDRSAGFAVNRNIVQSSLGDAAGAIGAALLAAA